jgi:hypothetical protein
MLVQLLEGCNHFPCEGEFLCCRGFPFPIYLVLILYFNLRVHEERLHASVFETRCGGLRLPLWFLELTLMRGFSSSFECLCLWI